MTVDVWLRRLTPTQHRIVILIASGEATSSRDLARHLGVGRETIRSHMQAIYDRLDVDDRIALVVRYWQLRYDELEFALRCARGIQNL